MKKTVLYLVIGLFVLHSKFSLAQPVVGLTSFYTTTTTALAANTACSVTKTTNLSGWLFSVSSSSNCGFNWTNSTGGDGRLQYLVGFGSLTQATFGSDDGSEFALDNLVWGVSTSSWTAKPMTFVGYKNGVAVPGATLNATTPSGTGILNITTVTFTNNPAFKDVDDIWLAPTTGTCNSILFFEEITVGTASSSCVTPTLSLTSSNNISCNGGNNGTASVSAVGGAPFTYTWSPSGGNGTIATGLSAGIYTCAATNSCGLTASRTVTITQPSALVTSTAVTNVACNGGSNGVAAISLSGGSGGYSYLWSTGGTSSIITGLMAGVYSATVTDINGCKASKNATITQPSALVTSTAVTNVACNGGSNGIASITASGGAGGYTYAWSNGGNTAAITGLMAGVYTATVTDANSCTAVKSAVITQPSALVTTTAVTNIACNGGSNGVASITASGGAGGYSYLWSNGGNTSSITGLVAGVYTATVTDANSCTSIKSAAITQPSALVTTTAVTNVACNGGSNGVASITATGGAGSYSYAWSNGAVSSSITGLVAGVYTATVTDANSCTSIKSAAITQPSALVTSTAVTNVACNGGSNGVASITASGGAGGYSYLWSTGSSLQTITGLMAGVYTATVTDANSCTSIKSTNITQPSALATTTAVTNVACNGGSTGVASINASGGAGSYSYAWSNGAVSSSITGLMAGVYTATVTDANSCTSIKSTNITQPSALVTTTAVTNVACNGGSNGVASVTASGGAGSYSYAWSNGAVSSSITGLMAGVYTATVTDANSCTSIKSTNITQPSALVTTTAVTNVACNGGSNGVASVTSSGGAGSYSYAWSNGAVSSSITGLMAGVYTATVTDANSCTSIKSVSITEPNLMAISASASPVLCHGGTSSITISATGGTGSYTGTGIFTITAGTFTFSVSDANSCESSTVLTISEPSVLSANASGSSILCYGGVSTITVSANGGTSPFTGVGTYTLMAGTETYTVTDNNGCVTTTSVNVTEPSVLSANASASPIMCYGGVSTITVSANGGTSPFTGVGTYTLMAGSETYTVTDNNGCMTTTSVTVSEPAPIAFSQTISLCYGQSVVVGSNTYSLGGTYSDIVPSLVNGCDSTISTIVFINALPTLSVVSSSSVLCTGSSATLTASGANTYTWSSTETTSAIVVSPTVQTTYTVTGEDANGCTAITTITQDIDVCTGLASISTIANDLFVYPNPSRDVFTIKTATDFNVTVMDVLGKVIYTEQLSAGIHTIDLASQANGVYVLKAESHGASATLRLVKN